MATAAVASASAVPTLVRSVVPVPADASSSPARASAPASVCASAPGVAASSPAAPSLRVCAASDAGVAPAGDGGGSAAAADAPTPVTTAPGSAEVPSSASDAPDTLDAPDASDRDPDSEPESESPSLAAVEGAVAAADALTSAAAGTAAAGSTAGSAPAPSNTASRSSADMLGWASRGHVVSAVGPRRDYAGIMAASTPADCGRRRRRLHWIPRRRCTAGASLGGAWSRAGTVHVLGHVVGLACRVVLVVRCPVGVVERQASEARRVAASGLPTVQRSVCCEVHVCAVWTTRTIVTAHASSLEKNSITTTQRVTSHNTVVHSALSVLVCASPPRSITARNQQRIRHDRIWYMPAVTAVRTPLDGL